VGNGAGDALAGHIGQGLIHQQAGVGVALANQTGVQPLFGDALELPEEVSLGSSPG